MDPDKGKNKVPVTDTESVFSKQLIIFVYHRNEMASLDELKQVVKETLEARGTLGQIRARIRAEVYNALDDPTDDKPEISSENFIINELILEYLEFNKYKYAASVLRTESGQPLQPLDRQFLREELNVREDRSAASVPLLYSIVGHFLHKSQPRNSAQEFDHRDQSWANPDVESDSAQRSGILFSKNGERR